jgi:peptidoglycan/xylan/chitin deacetylase (PgdA/CDA1 family)
VGNLLRNRSRIATFLSYHSVAEEGPAFLTVAPELFERQLAILDRLEIATGGLEELAAAAAGTLERPTVFLTFDDGFRDNREAVLPLLRERGMRAFVFVLPALMDSGAALEWPEVAEDRRRHPGTMRSLDWEMAAEMREGGFEVGSHTLTHPHLPDLGPEELRQELSDSRARIAERFGACEVLAYPFGDWNETVAAAARECGYRFAFGQPTATGQRDADPFSIPRINVDHRDRGRRFEAKLGAGKRFFLSPAVARLRRGTRGVRGTAK